MEVFELAEFLYHAHEINPHMKENVSACNNYHGCKIHVALLGKVLIHNVCIEHDFNSKFTHGCMMACSVFYTVQLMMLLEAN